MKIFCSEFGTSFLAEQSHVEVAIVRRSLRLAMSSGGGPRSGKIQQAVPVNARREPDQQFGCAAQPELLHLLRAEARYTYLRHPYGQMRERLNLLQLVRPFVDHPVIPVEWKPVHRDGVH